MNSTRPRVEGLFPRSGLYSMSKVAPIALAGGAVTHGASVVLCLFMEMLWGV